ncbi:hypothetical protein [Nakamurella leprariae]|uniref:Type II toxin-antitoxin system prevent-host-death family antitoxin n=1 Tax=Nakamurella leprariae TaxID=2803911 RepID=A0A938YG28_9ACTN|nr:hypothetical protein [Nakamurella leprariae]MBM9468876.1 hypothetical protein [Nakamurella leprariae]
MRRISQREVRNESGRALRELRDGEEFEVTVNGESFGILRMSPPPTRPRRSVSAQTFRAWYDDAPLSREHAEDWVRDIRESFDDDPNDPYQRTSGIEERLTRP